MRNYTVTFEHAQYGTVLPASSIARNPLAGLVRAAHAVGLKAKRINGHWQFWHSDLGRPSCYLIRSYSPSYPPVTR
jgi:hypothetical protein